MEGATQTTTVAEPSSPSPVSHTPTTTADPLVQVTFQKDPNRKHKFLESEPKALGCTQIVLGCFLINYGILDQQGIERWEGPLVVHILSGIFAIMAGSMAIAAQQLTLPYLKSCLGMQVIACVICGITFFLVMVGSEVIHFGSCYHEFDGCLMLRDAELHLIMEDAVVLITLICISATLAAYCCKVVQCCSPVGHVPVITVHVPADQQ
ncbi:uncharacterized protein LOC134437717 [Engraulis encrasicolus]|uniref:uncharacterized protein LOC134437717 n=1 Tax=Engraulis encrasicolus TaxID=184585 RepID=UPI002FCFB24D